MRRNELEEMLMGAQQRVRAACTLLMRPLACDADACLALFRDAQADLERLRERLAEGGVRGADLRGPAANLANDIRHGGVLLERAAGFGRRWLERLPGVSPEYTASGDRPSRAFRGRVSCLG